MNTNTRWRVRPHDPERLAALSRASGLSPLAAQILLNRGVDEPARARAFLESRLTSLHDPELLPGAAEAAERIVAAIREGRKIVIYGDYDVDGVCGTSLLWSCLRLAGARDVSYYIPHRVEEGYGVNAEAIERLARDDGAGLIITVDCGITALEQAERARALGVELIITDHHTIGERAPDASAVVHPRLPGSAYPNGDLCGAGVAFKLAWQVCKALGDGKKASPQMRDFLVRAMGLVALATVADVVPLSDENRVLVRHGIASITSAPGVGLRALLEVSGCLGKKRLTSGTIGYSIGPRINAAGRLEYARMAVELLTTDDPSRAAQIAGELDRCNARRQEVERTIQEEARAMIEGAGGLGDRRSIVLARENWHPGVIGIVAGRLVEIYHRPTIVLALAGSIAQGSARSVPGFDLHAAIHDCSERLLTFGGHPAAAGLKLEAVELPAFIEQFEERCRSALAPEQLERVWHIDAEVPLGVLSLRVVEELDRLEPFGIGNPRPLLLAGRLQVVGEPRPVGARKNHLQIRLRQGDVFMKAIGWNMAERGRALVAGTLCSIVFQPSINEWNGRREVQLEIKDFALDEESGGAHSHSHANADANPNANADAHETSAARAGGAWERGRGTPLVSAN